MWELSGGLGISTAGSAATDIKCFWSYEKREVILNFCLNSSDLFF
jgi:hypothetical protein